MKTKLLIVGALITIIIILQYMAIIPISTPLPQMSKEARQKGCFWKRWEHQWFVTDTHIMTNKIDSYNPTHIMTNKDESQINIVRLGTNTHYIKFIFLRAITTE